MWRFFKSCVCTNSHQKTINLEEIDDYHTFLAIATDEGRAYLTSRKGQQWLKSLVVDNAFDFSDDANVNILFKHLDPQSDLVRNYHAAALNAWHWRVCNQEDSRSSSSWSSNSLP